MRKNHPNTKSRIISAAWRLFYERGYEKTTVEDIVALSETSKGSFYHYFEGKDALLGTLSTLFDEKYEELTPSLDSKESCFEALMYLNRELFLMIENSVSIEMLSRLLSTQLFARGERHLLDRSRTYFKLLFKIVREGQDRGEICDSVSANEIVMAADGIAITINTVVITAESMGKSIRRSRQIPKHSRGDRINFTAQVA